MRASPVKHFAESRQLEVQQPASASRIDADNMLSDVDLLVVVAYGMIIPGPVLSRPRLGCINIHMSLLPRWRGAAPIQRAIQAGDVNSGISIMQMDAGLDTGDILLQRECPVHADETGGSLHDRLARHACEAILDALQGIHSGTITRTPQDDSLATYAHKIRKSEARIDWHSPVQTIERNIRAFNPFPVAHTILNDVEMRIWEAEIINPGSRELEVGSIVPGAGNVLDVQCADGHLRIRTLQLPGKNPVTAAEFLNGHQHFKSTR